MADCRQESPGKVAQVAFRFRAGEEELEELNLNDSDENREDSWKKFTGKLQKKVETLLNSKDSSLSDSENPEKSFVNANLQEDVYPLEASTDGLKRRSLEKNSKKDKSQQSSPDKPQIEIEPAVEAAEEVILPSKQISRGIRTRALLRSLRWLLPISICSYYLPVSNYWSGVVCGLCLVGLVGDVRKFLSSSEEEFEEIKKSFAVLSEWRHRPMSVQKTTFFNIYCQPYDSETYSVSQTRVACLELDDSNLKICWAKKKISHRAHFSDPPCSLEDSRIAIYDLTKVAVTLQPEGMTKKRLFSKKYPIVLSMGPNAILGGFEEGFQIFHYSSPIDRNLLKQALSRGQLSVPESNSSPPSPALSSYTPPYQYVIYLFARCDREKEDWYQRLVKASLDTKCPSETGLTEILDNETVNDKTEEYLDYMSRFAEMVHLNEGGEDVARQLNFDVDGIDVQWFNAFANRILFDVFRSNHWISKIQDKFQKKLSALKLPYYVEEMKIVNLDIGKVGPIFHKASRPLLDARGLWIDLDMTYDGSATFTIQTQFDLVKLQKGTEEESNQNRKSPVYDSDVEDSAESTGDDFEEDSSDEEIIPVLDTPDKTPKRKSSKKFFQLMENVARSKYFRQVANTRVLQKAIQGLSHTKLKLQVEVKLLEGTLVLNIPPPPSERLWIGFRGNPKLWLNARPILGERSVSFSGITKWIEKKIINEFQFLMVLPNMRFITLPLLVQNPDSPPATPPTSEPISPDEENNESPPSPSNEPKEDKASDVIPDDTFDDNFEDREFERRKSVRFSIPLISHICFCDKSCVCATEKENDEDSICSTCIEEGKDFCFCNCAQCKNKMIKPDSLDGGSKQGSLDRDVEPSTFDAHSRQSFTSELWSSEVVPPLPRRSIVTFGFGEMSDVSRNKRSTSEDESLKSPRRQDSDVPEITQMHQKPESGGIPSAEDQPTSSEEEPLPISKNLTKTFEKSSFEKDIERAFPSHKTEPFSHTTGEWSSTHEEEALPQYQSHGQRTNRAADEEIFEEPRQETLDDSKIPYEPQKTGSLDKESQLRPEKVHEEQKEFEDKKPIMSREITEESYQEIPEKKELLGKESQRFTHERLLEESHPSTSKDYQISPAKRPSIDKEGQPRPAEEGLYEYERTRFYTTVEEKEIYRSPERLVIVKIPKGKKEDVTDRLEGTYIFPEGSQELSDLFWPPHAVRQLEPQFTAYRSAEGRWEALITSERRIESEEERMKTESEEKDLSRDPEKEKLYRRIEAEEEVKKAVTHDVVKKAADPKTRKERASEIERRNQLKEKLRELESEIISFERKMKRKREEYASQEKTPEEKKKRQELREQLNNLESELLMLELKMKHEMYGKKMTGIEERIKIPGDKEEMARGIPPVESHEVSPKERGEKEKKKEEEPEKTADMKDHRIEAEEKPQESIKDELQAKRSTSAPISKINEEPVVFREEGPMEISKPSLEKDQTREEEVRESLDVFPTQSNCTSALKETDFKDLQEFVVSVTQSEVKVPSEDYIFKPLISFTLENEQSVTTAPLKFERMNFTSRMIALENTKDVVNVENSRHVVAATLQYPKRLEEFQRLSGENNEIPADILALRVLPSLPSPKGFEPKKDDEERPPGKADLTLKGFLPSKSSE